MTAAGGFWFVLGAAVALAALLAAARLADAVIVAAFALAFALVGRVRQRLTGAACGYRVYREGWRTPPCERPPDHFGPHTATESDGRTIAFITATPTGWGYWRHDPPDPPPST